jgi:EAL domain-containing protein (putative c-di-GMP-specific phosphodiesterase class I)/GGDEF domain-containing protein
MLASTFTGTNQALSVQVHIPQHSLFRRILHGRQIHCLYQPIFDLRTGAVFAWEALARGPKDSPLHSPMELFCVAEKCGQLFALEQVCRAQAIAQIGKLAPNQNLFLNIHPRTIADPQFTPGTTRELLDAAHIAAEQVVFEITERHAIQDVELLQKTLEHYRSQGFRVAVDDAGAGHSGLATIAALRPDFIKIDMGLVRDVDKDPVRRALMETMVTFAEKIGAHIVAEGIERKGEISTLMDIGVGFGQGYFLGRPSSPKNEAGIDIRELAPPRIRLAARMACSAPIGRIVQPVLTVTPDTKVSEVQRLLHRTAAHAVVVADQESRPAGLVMAHGLDRHLASLYGRSLYADKPITSIMDKAPLVADEQEPVEIVAQRAHGRAAIKVYDDVIVTSQERVLGTVTVHDMLQSLAQVQVEMAKGVNPLSGLPGNVALEKELELALRRDNRICLMYADLDNFKIYNDVYGFQKGDQIILLLARILAWAIGRHGSHGDFLAHVGGDDFVAIVDPARADRIGKAVVRCFRRLAPLHYTPEDRARGWIFGKGRDGQERQFPLVSVSIAIVEQRCQGCTLQTLSETAAQVKGYAKSLPGSVCVRDRRAR